MDCPFRVGQRMLAQAEAIEWNTATGMVTLSPPGLRDAVDRLLKLRWHGARACGLT